MSKPHSNYHLVGVGGVGMTPQVYLRQKRIEKACALFHDPDRNIKQISEETGFCDRYHFPRAFKDLQGITPFPCRRKFTA